MTTPQGNNLTWHQGQVTHADRARVLGHQGVTLWLTGLSASGKSTVAVALEKHLLAQGKHAYRLDGDNIRMGLNRNLGFSAEDRVENIRRIGEVAKLFADAGAITLASFISPYASDRASVRKLHEDAGLAYLEVFVDCPIEEAEKRDPKGLYKKARSGQIKGFTGIDDPYEAPTSPDVHLRTDQMSIDACVQMLMAALEQRGLLKA